MERSLIEGGGLIGRYRLRAFAALVRIGVPILAVAMASATDGRASGVRAAGSRVPHAQGLSPSRRRPELRPQGVRPRLPTIGGFSPASGGPDTRVTITGSGLARASSVSFGGSPASFSVESGSTISATVPMSARDGPIAVTTPAGTAVSASLFSVHPRTVVTRSFRIGWSPENPEEITSLSWNGARDLTNNWTNSGQCVGNPDLEFFGNAWGTGIAGEHAVLVGGSSGGAWQSRAVGAWTEVDVVSSAATCPPQTSGVPVTTTYRFPSRGNDFVVRRTFSFGATTFQSDLRAYIPRPYPASQFSDVYYPTLGGSLAKVNAGGCEVGCEITTWAGTWFAIQNWSTLVGLVVRRVSSAVPVALWVDEDGGSATAATSVLLLQPAGGFTGTITDVESLCFYKSVLPTLGSCSVSVSGARGRR